MADLHKHLKGIVKILKSRFTQLNSQPANIVTPADNVEQIKKLLTDFLPPSFGVGSGNIITKSGNKSKPLDIIIYHKYHKQAPNPDRQPETYSLSLALFIIEVKLTYNQDTLTEALDNIKSVKQLQSSLNNCIEPEKAAKKQKTPAYTLPFSIVCFYQSADDKETRETFFLSLKNKLEEYQSSHRPDYLFAFPHSASYINPTTTGESVSEYDIGLCIEPEFTKPNPCYVCRKRFTQRHFFYPRLCLKCGDFNYTKRMQTANLEGYIALVTGARVKIGYEVALKLLRDGASVIATSRFPHDTARRYSEEKDFNKWRDRLHIYGVDFRHIPSVEYFIQHLNNFYPRLDILINNAAQTIRRPPAFYAHLMPFESLPIEQLPKELQPLLNHSIPTNTPMLPGINPVTNLELIPVPGMNFSAALSQVPLLPEDRDRDVNLFPPDSYDADGQQIDKRPQNSWNLKLDEVSTAELLEVYLINAIVPFMFASKLKPLMMQSPAKSKYIINVAAMEGNFNQIGKQSRHPHTNMAKAALNMMTRTSGREYAPDNIFMNSVDPGWVSNENPYPIAMEMEAQGFKQPLNGKDAAARICDPIYVGINSGKNEWGKLFKDYLVSQW